MPVDKCGLYGDALVYRHVLLGEGVVLEGVQMGSVTSQGAVRLHRIDTFPVSVQWRNFHQDLGETLIIPHT